MEHSGGHLPFEYDVTSDLLYGQANRLTIAVNNTLTLNTLPPGSIKHYSTEDGYPRGYFTQVTSSSKVPSLMNDISLAFWEEIVPRNMSKLLIFSSSKTSKATGGKRHQRNLTKSERISR